MLEDIKRISRTYEQPLHNFDWPSAEDPMYVTPYMIELIMKSTDPSYDRYKEMIEKKMIQPYTILET